MGVAELPGIMIWCLSLTLVLELFAAAVLGIKGRDLLFVVPVNVVTNPVLVSVTVLIFTLYGRSAYYISLAVLEAAAVASEGLLYKFALKPKVNPFLLSLLLNAFSFFIGGVINRIFF